jgi:hypothetical protein
MRKIDEVIKQAVAIDGIPESLKNRLNYILNEKVAWCPPENMGMMWGECQIAINAHLPSKPEDLIPWQKTFLKVWTGKEW